MKRMTDRLSYSPVSEFMTTRFICLQHDTPPLEAARRTVTSEAKFLVIMHGKRPVSILNRGELLELTFSGKAGDNLLVPGTSWETAPLCSQRTIISVALELLDECNSTRMVVLGESGEVAGVVCAEQL
ncbi:MAG: hypothetical protein HXX11_18450 [Desulfuromonadales bacterium]|nr:hypothetical protein [Desulfuromonadales bacterium]